MKRLITGLFALVLVSAIGWTTAIAGHNTDDLVGYWSFDDGANPTVDMSGHGYDGVVDGATFTGDFAPDVLGNIDSLSFDGIDDVVTVADNADLDIQDELTISFWFRLDGESDDNAWPRVVSKGQTTTSDGAYGVFVKDSRDATDIGLRFVDTANATHDVRSTSLSYDDNQWHHVVATYSSVTGKGYLYVDGDQEASISLPIGTQIRTNDADLTIGAGLGDAQRHFSGGVDEVLIYDRALTVDEVSDLFTDGEVVGNPEEKISCKKGGWEALGFRNQGRCIQFFNTGKDSR